MERRHLHLRPEGSLGDINGELIENVIAFALVELVTGDDDLDEQVAGGTAPLPGVTFASLPQTKEIYDRVEVRQI